MALAGPGPRCTQHVSVLEDNMHLGILGQRALTVSLPWLDFWEEKDGIWGRGVLLSPFASVRSYR